ncbi:MAG: MbnP family protein [bacterium]|jgi:hypothetical protein
MKISNKQLSIILLAALSLTACKKDDDLHTSEDIDPNRKGELTIEFDNRVGNLNLVLDSIFYYNSFNQNYSISKFDYFISNIVLVNENGSKYVIPQDSSYFLLKESIVSSREINLSNIPEGNYSGIEFIVGVDSLRNTMSLDKRTGALDPGGDAAGMYWTWNSGYIFLKMEGRFDDTTDSIITPQMFQYHIGGFGGMNTPMMNNIKNITLNFGDEKAEVRASHGDEGPQVHLYVDASKMLNGTTNIDFKTHSIVMLTPFAVNMANNYSKMFSVDHVHNSHTH